MNEAFRICPKNKLMIERQLSNGQWGFYRICDSPNDAKRSLAAINGETKEYPIEQAELFEVA